ncbi:MAG: IS110 family transposase [Mesorhizobium sp.]|nr:MAG: IS110 family transposase [Mesorhizobium sp.]
MSRWCPLGSDNPSPDDVASDVTVGANVAAEIGNIRRFSDPQRLVAYLGFFRACGSR